MKELSNNNNNIKKHFIDIGNSMVITRRIGEWKEVEEGKAGINGNGRRLGFMWLTPNTIYGSCAIELYV